MARSRALYENEAARKFRAIIRPELLGRLKYIEPLIAVRAAIELAEWMSRLVRETMNTSELKDNKQEIRRQLLGGTRITGRSSLARLKSAIYVQPWIFPHEYGATIVPTGGRKYLTIPLGFALRADGSLKYRSALSWKRFGSFIKKDKQNDRLFIVYKSASGDLRYLYVLVDKVEIKARLGLLNKAAQLMDDLWYAWGNIYIQEMLKADVFGQSGLGSARGR